MQACQFVYIVNLCIVIFVNVLILKLSHRMLTWTELLCLLLSLCFDIELALSDMQDCVCRLQFVTSLLFLILSLCQVGSVLMLCFQCFFCCFWLQLTIWLVICAMFFDHSCAHLIPQSLHSVYLCVCSKIHIPGTWWFSE